MPKLSDLSYGEYIKAMFVGKSGSYKTGAIGSFPEPIKILNWDGQDRLQPLLKLYPGKDIDYENLSSKDVGKVDAVLDSILKNPKKFATYGFDSFTFFMQHAIRHSMRAKPGSKKVGDIPLMDIEHFGAESAAAMNLIEYLQDIKDCHFIITAHIVETTQKVLGSDKPRIDRKICTAGKTPSAMFPGAFSEVWSFHIEPAVRVGDPGTPYIITASGQEEDVTALEKTALPLPTRIDYGKLGLYHTIKDLLIKQGLYLK
jgi:hypothetical protein